MSNLVRFREMSLLDFQQHYEVKVKHYANELILKRNMSEELALSKAKNDYSNSFEKGFETPDTYFNFIVNQNNEDVGYIWYRIFNDNYTFILFFFIFEKYRKQGNAFMALQLFEKEMKDKGIKSIGLNVFDFNIPAISLYEKSVFKVVGDKNGSIRMEKNIESK